MTRATWGSILPWKFWFCFSELGAQILPLKTVAWMIFIIRQVWEALTWSKGATLFLLLSVAEKELI